MTIERAAAAVPSALSFSRTAMRELVQGRWKIEKTRVELDAEGRGEILYRLVGHGWIFHFFLISIKLPEEQKLDRNFAQSWDAMGVLCQGAWTPEREARLRQEVPKQRAGRADYDTLMYARGNRSGRLFDHVVESLAAGRQPDASQVAKIGYILRTTAFIGNGQLGTRPLAGYEPDHPMKRPYHAQVWSAFMLREYVFDLVNHMARARNPLAAQLNIRFRRYLGLGNSAATGLATYVASHPQQIDCWCQAHEVAIAKARARPDDPIANHRFGKLISKAIQYYDESRQDNDGIFTAAPEVAADLRKIEARFTTAGTGSKLPWQELSDWSQKNTCAEAFEVFNAILLDMSPDIVAESSDDFLADERFTIDAAMPLKALKRILQAHYGWALGREATEDVPYFWYRSAQAPRDVRRGIRDFASGFDTETTMDTALRLHQLDHALNVHGGEPVVAKLLLAEPSLRHIVARVQSTERTGYAELRVNYLSGTFSPFAPIRLVLSFYGMDKFEAAAPKSVRGAFLQGAPIAEDVASGNDGDWPFPLIPKLDDAVAQSATTLPDDSHATLPALKAPPPSPPEPTDTLIAAPIELQRLAQDAIQANSADLGVAQQSSSLVVFQQATHRSGVAALLVHIGRGLRGSERPLVMAKNGPVHIVDGHNASALLVAPLAADLAYWQASETGIGVTLVRSSHGADMLIEAAIQCAERGPRSLMIWKNNENPSGYALSEPSPGEAGIIAGSSDGVASRHLKEIEDALSHYLNINHKVEVDPLFGPMDMGFLLICLGQKTVGAGEARLYDSISSATQQLRQAPAALRLSPSQMKAQKMAWHRQGIPIIRASYDALVTAAARLYVPSTEEPRLRPGEVIDPLKMF